ncbi:MAG: alpha/beta hydrolase [Chloroflexota bacterium]
MSEEPGFIAFTPTAATPTAGFIFYPGGKVRPRRTRSAQAIAEAGYLVAIVPMPLNLALLGANGADAVIAAYPDIDTWVIGGHSLGGAMAATNYVDQHPGAVDGLALGGLSERRPVGPARPAGAVDARLGGGAERFSSRRDEGDAARRHALRGRRGRGNHEQMGDYTGQPN